MRTLKAFVKDENGAELMEFALVLALFSIVAVVGWEVLVSAGSTRQNTMQNNLANSALYPPS